MGRVPEEIPEVLPVTNHQRLSKCQKNSKTIKDIINLRVEKVSCSPPNALSSPFMRQRLPSSPDIETADIYHTFPSFMKIIILPPL